MDLNLELKSAVKATEKFEYYLASAFLSLGVVYFIFTLMDLGGYYYYNNGLAILFIYFISSLISTSLVCKKLEEDPLLMIGLKVFVLSFVINVTSNAVVFGSYAGILSIFFGLLFGIFSACISKYFVKKKREKFINKPTI